MALDALRRWRSTTSATSADIGVSRDRDSEKVGERPGRVGTYRIAVAILIVLVLLVIFQYAMNGPDHRSGLVANRQVFTELYFSQPNSLPTVLKHNQINVSFVIANYQGASHLYNWTADFVQGGIHHHLARGSVDVRNRDQQLIPVVVVPSGITGAGLFVVTLSSPHQMIDFHLTILSGIPAR